MADALQHPRARAAQALPRHDDLREAQRRAEAIWYEATYRAQQGLTARAHTFESVAEEYIGQILRVVERGERKADQGKSEPAVIRRYFVGYFGQRSPWMQSVRPIWSAMRSGGAPTGPRALASLSPTSSTRGEATGYAGPYAAQRPL